MCLGSLEWGNLAGPGPTVCGTGSWYSHPVSGRCLFGEAHQFGAGLLFAKQSLAPLHNPPPVPPPPWPPSKEPLWTLELQEQICEQKWLQRSHRWGSNQGPVVLRAGSLQTRPKSPDFGGRCPGPPSRFPS